MIDNSIRLQNLHLQPGHTVDANETVENLVEAIKSQRSTHRTYVVMKKSKPIGIIRSTDLFRLLGTLYGVALHYKKRLYEVMYSNILIVDWMSTIEEVSRKAMGRSYEDIYDDIIVTHNEEYKGVIPVYELLKHMTDHKVKEAIQKNPLSGLPGNERIQEILNFRKEKNQPFTVIYTDIDHFKPYNDVYGFKYGDDVIKWVSEILQKPEITDLFVGHIGGDDFFTILLPHQAEDYCKYVIELFEHGKPQFYNHEDISKNFIVSLDRQHQTRQFSLITLSMAILDIYPDDQFDTSKISSMTAFLKKKTKQLQGSNYYRGSTTSLEQDSN